MILKNPKTSEQLCEKLGAMLNSQKDNELYNHDLYKEMSNWFKRQGLYKLSEYYNARGEEEKHHHDWIIERLKECNYPITYPAKTGIIEKWDDNFRPFEITIDAEFKTTKDISNIVTAAFDEKDYKIAYWLMEKLISEQHEEEYISKLVRDIANQDTDWLTKEEAIYSVYFKK